MRAPESLQAEVHAQIAREFELATTVEKAQSPDVADTQDLPVVKNPVSDMEETIPEQTTEEETPEQTTLRTLLESLSDDRFAALMEKHTKNDMRWKKERKIKELLLANITVADIYGD